MDSMAWLARAHDVERVRSDIATVLGVSPEQAFKAAIKLKKELQLLESEAVRLRAECERRGISI